MSIERSASGKGHGTAAGVYGLQLRGVDARCALLGRAERRWARVDVVRRQGEVPWASADVGGDRTEFPLVGGGRLVMDRPTRRAVFVTPGALPDAELVHPYLAPAAATFARWDGREAFHAGAFACGDRVWALVGDRTSGKSTTLACMARGGYKVVCDDLLVVDSGMVFAGPRCIDLRSSAARRLGVTDEVSRERPQRWRLMLQEVSPELPLAGWVFLEWGAEVAMTKVPVRERLSRLASHRSVLVEPADPGALLALAALPAWTLTRPRTWRSLDRAVGRLTQTVTS